jgi:hypothetical protein
LLHRLCIQGIEGALILTQHWAELSNQ